MPSMLHKNYRPRSCKLNVTSTEWQTFFHPIDKIFWRSQLQEHREPFSNHVDLLKWN